MQYFAFLRAINVTNRFVKMGHLKQLFVDLGFDKVDTYIQSGNVIFDSNEESISTLTTEIQEHLKGQLGFEVPTFLRSQTDLQSLANQSPFDDVDHGTNPSYYVSFTYHDFTDKMNLLLQELNSETDQFQTYGNHLFWLYRREKGKSTLDTMKLERKLKIQMTRRNMNTVNKIVKKFCS